jgi:DNA-binding NtrC family response regulator
MKLALLCVDDEAILTLAISRSIRTSFGPDLHVVSASSAAEAFEAIAELEGSGEEVRMVISDLLMPEMRGDDFLRVLHQRFPDIKTILLSGMPPDCPEAIVLKEEVGLYANLSKPANMKILTRLVREALSLPDSGSQE